MLTSNALAGFKNHVKRTVAYAKYKIDSSYYRSELTDVSVDASGKIRIDFVMDPQIAGSVNISAVQLYDGENKLWLETSANITRKSTQEGIFYRFTINIFET